MKRFSFKVLAGTMALFLMLTGCVAEETSAGGEGKTAEAYKIGFIVGGKLGDQGFNDATLAGIEQFVEETGAELTTVETVELQDNEINARNFAQEGYDLVIIGNNMATELLPPVAEDFPDTHFIIFEGTVDGLSNVTSLRSRIAEAGFLTGAFSSLMNKELGGEMKSAFVGGVRNASLERSQYSFTAGSEYVGGESAVVYVGNFNDVTKGKEIALQLYKDGYKLVQGYAGTAGIGVFQAAESMGEGYYALGGATGQFEISPAILASQVKSIDRMVYDACTQFAAGTLESGILEVGLATGAVGIAYAPDSEGKIPQTVKDEIQELEDKIINGELVPPSNEGEYDTFAQQHLKK